jgi:trehalose 6-phosphate synthase/phosphatase
VTDNSKLLVVSNRLPVTIERGEDGLVYHPAAGGLATSLQSVRKKWQMRWLGWPGIQVEDAAEQQLIDGQLRELHGSIPLFIPAAEFEAYYQGFSNGTIWPLFHYFPQNTHYDAGEWRAYQSVNRLFRDKIVEMVEPGERIWVHDYHLLLLPQLIREALPDARIGFFLHIPFPSSEIFRTLPWREEVLHGLLGADIIGFHSHGYARHFQSSLLRLLGLENEFGRVIAGDRPVLIDTFPIGVDMDGFEAAIQKPEVEQELERLRGETGDRKIVVTVDRLDFTKGISERLKVFEEFLTRHPEWRRRVTLISLTVPSRTDVPEYQALKREVDELVGRINGRFGEPGWVPIWYLYRFMSFERLVALYRAGDVALVTPLRDGMNLVAKEYLASHPEGTGVLILSETAGAAEELGEALIVNPHDTDQMIDALQQALTMSEEQQRAGNQPMLARLRRYDVVRWADDFLERLEPEAVDTQEQEHLSGPLREQLLRAYRKAERRLLFLDYDGTMVPFAAKPEFAAPDAALLDELKALTANPKNSVVVISGRDADTLYDWLGGAGADLVAEHGAMIRRAGEAEWVSAGGQVEDGWKAELRPLMQLYVDRTPGALLEEKSASLAWHHRRAEPELGDLRAKQLLENLEAMIANTPLVIIQGNKVVEVKESGVSKGLAAKQWLDREPAPDFILATGDDVTDEEMFEVMPDEAWTIRVGQNGHSIARYSLPAAAAVRSLLQAMA